ncbi:TPA: hypothetical protein DCP77_02870 [Candidatus Collierbacteria bacterium]|uniref:Uncharacterized protein n=1 Tax=Candidatus Collierbacteria bacterium GW2011_GWA2_42_17 TaxID=1618378 RepID=A0A0G0Z3S3_9BACT|nr:MAG: hypothetical protein UU94_C0001G0116 [Candidatus Collierbacteria bacterium GW2011_GWB2_42_12]KKS43385.1 MAG: hypothetical protein UV06_C0001G0119 [Candidatus Collierbacteria bacterium GW2011_GWA2_42_17]KKS62683.1 MAG: hypothetical protein UV28_C0006G0003 [Candidatus Collierbacteria bacterium GW2011_GWE2_42_48]KKS63150.1 MAG: hypothetical protein UV30_C0006G0003 [Candidatus Collierbacteria bacterium GW2011_GWF1_42_50]KKS67039.1 MAG: hypothetical protein UV37_C0012G0014 [Candidatus Collie
MRNKEAETNKEMGSEKLVYLLPPVRNVTEEQALTIAEYAKSLDVPEIRLFNPVRDAPQQDATGYNIVMAELGFLHEAAKSGGRVDILWNAGDIPSEGSRVDIGIALALGLNLNLIHIFNKENPTGPQICFKMINGMYAENLEQVKRAIQNSDQVLIDWDVEMKTEEQEWQRIFLGIALGEMTKNPSLKIKLGNVVGIDPPEKKSYIKVVKEIESR